MGKRRSVRDGHEQRRADTFRTVSAPEDATKLSGALNSFLPLPNATPFYMLQVYGFLRDAIPDISDGVWTWKRLCQTYPNSAEADRSAYFLAVTYQWNGQLNSGKQ